MSTRNRFEKITSNLVYTDRDRPTYIDKFWEVRQMIDQFNQHMFEVFSAGWICCLDESMSIWTNKWTCPGWVWCPRKPHPFGNEYHDICCGTSGILFRIFLKEGKDHPKERDNDRTDPCYMFRNFSATTKLLLFLCETIFYTGRVIVLDSGFCVLKSLIVLKQYGVFAAALIKKRRYWPFLVPGDKIEERMKDKPIGTVDAIRGVLDGIKVRAKLMNVFVLFLSVTLT